MKSVSRRCSNCRKKVAASESIISRFKAFCTYECLKDYTEKNADKLADKTRKQKRQEDRVRKEKLKTKGQWTKEAQAAVNAYVRWRDRNKNCISCNASLKSEALGGGYDAGHYRSRGSAPHLRFRTDQIFGQCKKCNRYLSGNVDKMRVGIVWRYGQEYLDRIEMDNTPKHYSIDDLKRIKRIFTKKLRLRSNTKS